MCHLYRLILKNAQDFLVVHSKFASFLLWSTRYATWFSFRNRDNKNIDYIQVGLIYKGNEMQIPLCVWFLEFLNCNLFNTLSSAYELYADPKSDLKRVTRVGSQTQEKMSSAERFKKAFSYKDVKVHFVGAWYVTIIQAVWKHLKEGNSPGTLFRQLE